MAEFSKIKKANLSDAIVEQIKQKLLDNQLQPGEKLPSERELAAMLGVSRPSVREALRSLSSIGIVSIRSGEGTFLTDDNSIMLDYFQIKNLQMKFGVKELIEARIILEMQIVALAAERGTSEDFLRMQECFDATLRYREMPAEFLKADFEFHMAIAAAAQNAYLGEMLGTTRDLLLEVNKTVIAKPGQMMRAIESHHKILHAIREKDGSAAVGEMKEHIQMLMIGQGA